MWVGLSVPDRVWVPVGRVGVVETEGEVRLPVSELVAEVLGASVALIVAEELALKVKVGVRVGEGERADRDSDGVGVQVWL